MACELRTGCLTAVAAGAGRDRQLLRRPVHAAVAADQEQAGQDVTRTAYIADGRGRERQGRLVAGGWQASASGPGRRALGGKGPAKPPVVGSVQLDGLLLHRGADRHQQPATLRSGKTEENGVAGNLQRRRRGPGPPAVDRREHVGKVHRRAGRGRGGHRQPGALTVECVQHGRRAGRRHQCAHGWRCDGGPGARAIRRAGRRQITVVGDGGILRPAQGPPGTGRGHLQ